MQYPQYLIFLEQIIHKRYVDNKVFNFFFLCLHKHSIMNQKQEHISEFNKRIFNSDIWKNYPNIIFVYTPPKVGSTSLVSSLRLSASEKYMVLHVHDETMLSVLTGYENPHNVTIMDIIHFNALLGKKVFVIDIYRTPLERKMSLFFEKLACFHFNNKEENMNKYDLNKLMHRFNCLFMHIGNEDYFQEKYELTDIDNFDFDKKYLKNIVNENITFIKLRLQDFDQWSDILSNLLNIDIFMIQDNKETSDLYHRFKKEYKVPINFLEWIKDSDNHFLSYNSEVERKLYIDKWTIKCTERFLSNYTKEEYFFYLQISKENQWQNIIQKDHYLDFGCVCYHCIVKRREIKNALKRGENISTCIIHDQIIQEKQANIKNKFVSSLQYQINNYIKNKPKLTSTQIKNTSKVFNKTIYQSKY